MSQKQIVIPAGIPLIGQGPSPEQVNQLNQEAQVIFKTWPVTPFPTSAEAGAWWGGQTMLHSFAMEAMKILKDQFAAKSQTNQELVDLCKKCWLIAIMMQRTAPFGHAQEKTDDSSAPSSNGDGQHPPGTHDVPAPVLVG